MALNKGWDRHFFINKVMRTGRSLNVTKGQFAVVNTQAQPTKNGSMVIDDFAGLSKDTKLKILQGIAKDGEPRTQSNKPWSTKDFKIGEITDLKVGVPSTDFQVDRFVIGYNGFDEDTAISLEPGETESINITLSGEAIGMMNYNDGKASFTFTFGKPHEGDMTDQEVVEELVQRMRRAQFAGGIPITKYVDIDVVNSENPEMGELTGTTEQVFYHLTVEDTGDSNAFASVQGQYPDHKVVKSDRKGGQTTYTIMGDAGLDLEDFTKFKRGILKGCDACPEGYTELSGGLLYSVAIEDDGADSTSAISGISPNVTADSAEKVGEREGVSYYVVVTSEELTQDELDTFVDANPSAIVELAARQVQEFCSPDNLDTVSWTTGESCVATTENYTIIVGDDECGESRADEIQAYYDDLEITSEGRSQCSEKFSTTVVTNVVCDDCDPAFRDIFVSEAPEDFRENSWKKEEPEYSETALMGIMLTGKKIELAGSEAYRDYMPFLATSVRISVAGGYYMSQTASYHEGSGERFPVQILSRATEPENLGGNLQELEEASRRYFDGESRQYQNAYGTWVKGEESLLDPMTPYVDYVLTVRIKTMTQELSGEKNETFHYHFVTEVGVHQEVEEILNRLAASAGVSPVQAFGKSE